MSNKHDENLMCNDKMCKRCNKKISDIEVVLTLIKKELIRAMSIFPPMSSHHEAIAVIEEEFLELRREVFNKYADTENMRKEAEQLAAMCVRMMVELN